MSFAGPKNGVEMVGEKENPQENLCHEAQDHITLAFDLSSLSWGLSFQTSCLNLGKAGLWPLPRNRLQSFNKGRKPKSAQISCSEMSNCFFMFLLIFRSFCLEV